MLRGNIQGDVANAGNNNSGVMGENVLTDFTVQTGNVISVQGDNVDNSTRIEYHIHLLTGSKRGAEAQAHGDLTDQEKWKELTEFIETRIKKLSEGDDDISDDSEEYQTSEESEPPVDTRRLIIYSGVDIAKKKLKSAVEIVFTLTPVGLSPGGKPWATIVWRVLQFRPSTPMRQDLTWYNEVGFCDLLEENNSTLKPGELSQVVKPKHIAVLQDIEGNPDFSAHFKMTLETAGVAVLNKLDSSQRLALCSIDRDRVETDQFSPVIDIGSVKSNDIFVCGPPVMLQAYAVPRKTERLPIDTCKISRSLFVDSAGKQKPIDIRTLRSSTAFRLYTNTSGKIILEKD